MMSKVLMYNKKTKKLFWYNKESEDKTTTEYIQLGSKSAVNPQNGDYDMNSTIIVGTFYDQDVEGSILVPTTVKQELSATINIPE